MAEVTGIIQEITTRDVAGGKKAYNIVVGGESYGAGLYAPKCKVGDYVKFELDESRGYKNVGRNSLKVSANKPPAEAIAAAAKTIAKSSTGSTVDSRQDTISRQAAMNTAISFLQLLSANDALGLPASAKGKKAEALEAMLHQFTADFYERNTGVVWKDISPSKKDAPDEAEDEELDVPADDKWE